MKTLAILLVISLGFLNFFPAYGDALSDLKEEILHPQRSAAEKVASLVSYAARNPPKVATMKDIYSAWWASASAPATSPSDIALLVESEEKVVQRVWNSVSGETRRAGFRNIFLANLRPRTLPLIESWYASNKLQLGLSPVVPLPYESLSEAEALEILKVCADTAAASEWATDDFSSRFTLHTLEAFYRHPSRPETARLKAAAEALADAARTKKENFWGRDSRWADVAMVIFIFENLDQAEALATAYLTTGRPRDALPSSPIRTFAENSPELFLNFLAKFARGGASPYRQAVDLGIELINERVLTMSVEQFFERVRPWSPPARTLLDPLLRALSDPAVNFSRKLELVDRYYQKMPKPEEGDAEIFAALVKAVTFNTVTKNELSDFVTRPGFNAKRLWREANPQTRRESLQHIFIHSKNIEGLDLISMNWSMTGTVYFGGSPLVPLKLETLTDAEARVILAIVHRLLTEPGLRHRESPDIVALNTLEAVFQFDLNSGREITNLVALAIEGLEEGHPHDLYASAAALTVLFKFSPSTAENYFEKFLKDPDLDKEGQITFAQVLNSTDSSEITARLLAAAKLAWPGIKLGLCILAAVGRYVHGF